MEWLIPLAVAVVALALVARALRRAFGAVRGAIEFATRATTARGIAGMLSAETREALARHGIDSEAPKLDALRGAPELHRRVQDDLRRAFGRMIRERGAPAGASPAPQPERVESTLRIPAPTALPSAAELPEPIGETSAGGGRTLMLALAVGLAAALLVRWLGWA